MTGSSKKSHYAYFVPGGERGVAVGWAACEKKVSGVPGARYRGFVSRAEAEAWLRAGAAYEVRPPRAKAVLRPGVYFDAGTGRGDGVESSVTDERGKDLLHLVLPAAKLNRFGKYRVPGSVTNNYGELLACKYAIRAAESLGIRHVSGDSRLVLDYWSKGIRKEKALPKKTLDLIAEVAAARRAFEAKGGAFFHVPGADNPADLGFH